MITDNHTHINPACEDDMVGGIGRRARQCFARPREFFRKAVIVVLTLAAALAIGTTAATAQKIQDRHPAYAVEGLTFEQRWDGVREIPLTFEERWEPVRQLLVENSFREVLKPRAEPTDAPAGSPARPRPVRVVTVGGPVTSVTNEKPQATCLRHRMRTVYRGARWNCRR